MRLKSIQSGGSWRTEPIEVELYADDGASHDPPVLVQIIPVPLKDVPAIRRKATVSEPDPRTGRVKSEFSRELFELEYFTAAIVGWSGIETVDGQVIETPTRDAVTALIMDPNYKRQLDAACFQTEAAVSAESFREPGDVVPMVSERR